MANPAIDPILYWNAVALEANKVSHTDLKDTGTLGPILSSRALAIIHLAMYDAYAGTAPSPDLPPYYPGGPAPAASASPEAAVAAAAHATLSKLFPSQKAVFDRKHAEAGLSGDSRDLKNGHDYGLAIAQRLLDDRGNDPDVRDDGYAAPVHYGAHRVDPDNPDQGYYAPFYGARARLFAAPMRRTLDDPMIGSPEYVKALQEVRGKGIAPELMGTLPKSLSRRTVDETLIGIYWAYDGASGLGTPPRQYNQIVRIVAMAQNNTVAKNARLFALVNVAMADAGTLAWEQKYRHNLWRPVVGIREHDKSMGPTGTGKYDLSDDCDISWLPLGAPRTNTMGKNVTPNFPAYPSGHATFGAAAFHITRLLYGVTSRGPDNLFDHQTFVSEELNGINKDTRGTVRPRHVRKFPQGLWQMIEENGRSRVYLGVHWVFDAFAVDAEGNMDLTRNIGGVPLGLDLAEDIFKDGMKRQSPGATA